MRTLAAVVLALASTGCVSERSKAIPTIPGPFLARGASGGSESRIEAPPADSGEAFSHSPSLALEAASPVDPMPVSSGAVRTGAYAGHRPLARGESLESRARSRFLDSETTVDAREASVYLPADLAREASLTGAAVEEASPGRRVATGGALLRVRRLTVRAVRVTFVSRTDGKDDVQVSARGDVSFRSDQPASVLEERGLRSLLLRNDVHTPLR